jgi:hypothetical protein
MQSRMVLSFPFSLSLSLSLFVFFFVFVCVFFFVVVSSFLSGLCILLSFACLRIQASSYGFVIAIVIVFVFVFVFVLYLVFVCVLVFVVFSFFLSGRCIFLCRLDLRILFSCSDCIWTRVRVRSMVTGLGLGFRL